MFSGFKGSPTLGNDQMQAVMMVMFQQAAQLSQPSHARRHLGDSQRVT